MASLGEREATDESRARSAAFAWAPVALWIAVIWILGGEAFAVTETTSFIVPLLHSLFPSLSPETLDAAHYTLRVLAHPTQYAVLALLALRAFRATGARLWTPLGGSLSLVLAVAIADEVRQAAGSARTGASTDVALDFAGGVIALAVAFALRRLRG
jgi:VanZ family protein